MGISSHQKHGKKFRTSRLSALTLREKRGGRHHGEKTSHKKQEHLHGGMAACAVAGDASQPPWVGVKASITLGGDLYAWAVLVALSASVRSRALNGGEVGTSS